MQCRAWQVPEASRPVPTKLCAVGGLTPRQSRPVLGTLAGERCHRRQRCSHNPRACGAGPRSLWAASVGCGASHGAFSVRMLHPMSFWSRHRVMSGRDRSQRALKRSGVFSSSVRHVNPSVRRDCRGVQRSGCPVQTG